MLLYRCLPLHVFAKEGLNIHPPPFFKVIFTRMARERLLLSYCDAIPTILFRFKISLLFILVASGVMSSVWLKFFFKTKDGTRCIKK